MGVHEYAEFKPELPLAGIEMFLDNVAIRFQAEITYYSPKQGKIIALPQHPFLIRSSDNHEILGEIKANGTTVHFSLHRNERGDAFIGIGFGLSDSEKDNTLAASVADFARRYNC